MNVAIHHIYIILPQVTSYIEPGLRPGGQDKGVVTLKDKKRNETRFLYLTLTVTLSPDPNHLTTSNFGRLCTLFPALRKRHACATSLHACAVQRKYDLCDFYPRPCTLHKPFQALGSLKKIREKGSLVPTPRPAFRRFQYGKAREGLVSFLT